MNKLLMIADDFTGALDTGVQFASYGAATCVVTDPDCDYAGMSDSFQVLVLDAESRHMTARQAYDTVHRAVRSAIAAGYTYIYKKTDSALRGNVGAELDAVMDAAGADSLSFFPAFPAMDRVTRGGIHYIHGVPVAESVFGRDPFEPVTRSAVADIISEQTDRPVVLHGVGDLAGCAAPGIHVYDASTNDDLHWAALALKTAGQLHYLAGCAGFASVLPDLLEMQSVGLPMPRLTGRLLTICGSVNPITQAQMDKAEQAGAVRISLTPSQKLDPDWVKTREGRQAVAGWLERIRSAPAAIVECGVADREGTEQYAKALGLDLNETRRRIASTMGGVLQRLLDMGLERDLLVTGGDTLLAFMDRIGQDTLIPLGEPTPGVVLSQIRYGGRSYNLMSKSGGFGPDTLMTDLASALKS